MKIVDEELNKLKTKNDDLKEKIVAASKEYSVILLLWKQHKRNSKR